MSYEIKISVANQLMQVLEAGVVVKSYPVSTATNGIGFEEGSFKTPTGQFEVSEMIGEGAAPCTIFEGRLPIGTWLPKDTTDADLVLTRILWLNGLDEENLNTKSRYIYIHGTNQEELIGHPSSHGCVRMRNADVIELFDLVTVGTPVSIL